MRYLLALMIFAGSTTGLTAEEQEIPLIESQSQWQKIEDVAQYKMADWSQVIGKAEDVTVLEAKKIAESDPQITYFFMKGGQMVLENLETDPETYRVFHHGDAVFFSGEPWWGSATDLADGYIKQ